MAGFLMEVLLILVDIKRYLVMADQGQANNTVINGGSQTISEGGIDRDDN